MDSCKTATFNFQLAACRDVVAAVAAVVAVVVVIDLEQDKALLGLCFDRSDRRYGKRL